MAKKILITGITGQVGSQLADFVFENTSHDVVGMMRWQEPLDNLYHLTDRINRKDRISLHYADLNDFSVLARMLKTVQPDYISHLAAQSYPKTSFDIPIETLQTNIIGTANLLEAVRQQKEAEGYDPVVHVCSSSEVYGRAKPGMPLAEDTPFHGASPYSISKIGTDYLGRFYGEAYGIRTFVTRMGTHSDPRRSDVFFESTVAKQIALIEAGYQTPEIRVGNLSSTPDVPGRTRCRPGLLPFAGSKCPGQDLLRRLFQHCRRGGFPVARGDRDSSQFQHKEGHYGRDRPGAFAPYRRGLPNVR